MNLNLVVSVFFISILTLGGVALAINAVAFFLLILGISTAAAAATTQAINILPRNTRNKLVSLDVVPELENRFCNPELAMLNMQIAHQIQELSD